MTSNVIFGRFRKIFSAMLNNRVIRLPAFKNCASHPKKKLGGWSRAQVHPLNLIQNPQKNWVWKMMFLLIIASLRDSLWNSGAATHIFFSRGAVARCLNQDEPSIANDDEIVPALENESLGEGFCSFWWEELRWLWWAQANSNPQKWLRHYVYTCNKLIMMIYYMCVCNESV